MKLATSILRYTVKIDELAAKSLALVSQAVAERGINEHPSQPVSVPTNSELAPPQLTREVDFVYIGKGRRN